MRDKLSKDVSNAAMKLMLELNNQEIPSGESKVGGSKRFHACVYVSGEVFCSKQEKLKKFF